MSISRSDIAALAKGMAPAIVDQIEKATAPLQARIAALEGKNAHRMTTRGIDDDAARQAIEGSDHV